MGVVDLTSWPEAGRRAEAVRLAQAEATRPFELSRELFRVWLIRLSAEEHILLVMLHHIISDVWSLLGILRARAECGVCGVSGRPAIAAARARGCNTPTMPSGSGSGCRARCWSGSWPIGGSNCADPGCLELPTDRPRPATLSYKGARHPLALSKELTAAA